MREIEIECGCGEIQIFEVDGNEVLYTHDDICPGCGSPPDDYQIEQMRMWCMPSATSIRRE
jgi:hypothetical protein